MRAIEGRTENSRLWQASLLVLLPGHFWQGGPVTAQLEVRCRTKKTSSEEEGNACSTCLGSAEGSAAGVLFGPLILDEAQMFAFMSLDSFRALFGRGSQACNWHIPQGAIALGLSYGFKA